MSFENKNNNIRQSSKIKAPIDSNNKQNLINNKKKIATSEELKKELEEAENFLQKANKEFQNFKSKEIRKDNIENNSNKYSEFKFIEKTLEENGVLKKNNNNKIPLQQFLKENMNQNNFNENNSNNNTLENKDYFSSLNTNNNLEITKFDNNFNLSNPSRENLPTNFNRESSENLKNPIDNNINKGEYISENHLMNKYRKQLRANGFPEIGNIFFQNENDQESLFKFLDYVLIKKCNENGDKLKLKKTCEEFKEKLIIQQNENCKLEKECQLLRDNLKKLEKENKFLNDKLSRIKETNDKAIADVKIELNKYKNRYNFLQVEKKSFEEKYSKMAENYQKFFSKLNQANQNVVFHKPANIDIVNVMKKNDLIKILSKVNGTEKLIETIKNGFNESLRELLFEISALKNFILEINSEIIEYATKLDLKGLINLESNFINMPFLDAIPKIKYALKTNIKKSFDFWNLEDPKLHNFNNDLQLDNNFNMTKNNQNNNMNNRDNMSSIFHNNTNKDDFKNDKFSENKNNPESLSAIRERNDSLFEIDKSDKIKNHFNNSILKNNQEMNLFDQTNYDHLIDFDLDNIDLDDSNTQSTKIAKKNSNPNSNLENKNNNLPFDNEIKNFDKNKIDNENNYYIKKNKKEDQDGVDKELEYLKEKWMKALSG